MPLPLVAMGRHGTAISAAAAAAARRGGGAPPLPRAAASVAATAPVPGADSGRALPPRAAAARRCRAPPPLPRAAAAPAAVPAPAARRCHRSRFPPLVGSPKFGPDVMVVSLA
jgi:hypothetical protein